MHLPGNRARGIGLASALLLAVVIALLAPRPIAGQTPTASTTPPAPDASPTATAPSVSPSLATATPERSVVEATALAGSTGGTTGSSGATGEASRVATLVAITVAPERLPVKAEAVEAAFLVLVDANGAATTRAVPTLIRLASSDPALATIPGSVEIPAGTSAVAVPVRALAPGQVTFTAQATGLTSGQTRLTVTAPTTSNELSALQLAFAPQFFLSDAVGPALLTVSVVRGDAAQPAVAASPLDVRLVSSNSDAISVAPLVTIPAGQFFVTVPVVVGVGGTAKVTALRSGLVSATTETSVSEAGDRPVRLAVSVVPPRQLAGGQIPTRLVIRAVAESGAPTVLPCGAFELASTAPLVQPVPDRATPACAAGQQSVLIELERGQSAGETTLTIAAEGLEPVSTELAASGEVGAELTITLAPAALMYDTPSAGWIAVEVLDRNGAPVTVTGDLTVRLEAPAGVVPAELVIPRGASYVLAPLGRVDATQAAGEITASAVGLRSTQVSLTQRPALTPALTSGVTGEGPLAIQIAGLSIPLAWLFTVAVIAVIGVLAVAYMSARQSRESR